MSNSSIKVSILMIPTMLVIIGCETPSTVDATGGDEVWVKEVPLPEPDVRQELCWGNDLFEYKVSEGGRSFKCLSKKATLRDLANFAMNDCYNGYLVEKIKGNKPLTEEDGILLAFILNAQLTTVDTFSVALLGDMTSPGALHGFIVQCKDRSNAFSRDLSNPEILRQQNDAFTELKLNFIEESSGIRAPMRLWGTGFKAIDQAAIASVFQELRKESKSADNSNGSYIRNHPWIWGSSILFSGLIGGSLVYSVSPDSFNDIEKACDKYDRDSAVGNEQWQAMRQTLSIYTDELDRLVNDMQKYVSSEGVKDGASRRIVENVLANTRNDYQGAEKYLDYAIYDLPFALLTYKARARMKDCQGFFNDDEEKMKEVWTDYALAVSDKDMLRNLRTWYSASSYLELIRLLKKELWEGDFKEFCKQTRLYKINRVNKGKVENNISPFYDEKE